MWVRKYIYIYIQRWDIQGIHDQHFVYIALNEQYFASLPSLKCTPLREPVLCFACSLLLPPDLNYHLLAQLQGRVNPLQTTFKRDTTGLGAAKLRPRVTHFPSHVQSQAINSADGKSDAVRAHERLENPRDRHKRHRRRRVSGDRGVNSGSDIGGVSSRNGGVQQISNDQRQCRVLSAGGRDGSVNNTGRGGFWGSANNSSHNNSSSSGGSSSNGGYATSNGGNARRRSAEETSTWRRAGEARAASGLFLPRAERKAKETAEKQRDRRTRFDLFSDIPEEFASLFTGPG